MTDFKSLLHVSMGSAGANNLPAASSYFAGLADATVLRRMFGGSSDSRRPFGGKSGLLDLVI